MPIDEDVQRRVNARIEQLLRDADAAEADAVEDLLGGLQALQDDLRGQVAAAAGAAALYARLMADLDKRIDTAFAALQDRIAQAIVAASAAGAAMVDQAVVIAGAPAARASAPSPAAIADRARRFVDGGRLDLSARIGTQLLLRDSGRRDLEQVLTAIGTSLRGSAVFGAPTDRTVTVARTESGHAHGDGVQARMESPSAGVKIRKRWVWSHDPNGRSSHAEAQARYAPGGAVGPIPPDQLFLVGSYRTPYPRGPGLPGAQKLNCGCRSVPVVTEVETP